MTSSTVPGDQSFRDSSTYPEWDTDGATRRHSRATVSAAIPSHGPLLVDIVDTMKMRDVGIAVLAASLTTAGLVYLHERPPDRPAAAQVVRQVTCLDPGMFPGHFPPPVAAELHTASIRHGPRRFPPGGRRECDSLGGGTYFGADGQNPAGEAVIVDEVRREGDLGELLGAMAERSDPQVGDRGMVGWQTGPRIHRHAAPPARHVRCCGWSTEMVVRSARGFHSTVPADKVDAHYAMPARLSSAASSTASMSPPRPVDPGAPAPSRVLASDSDAAPDPRSPCHRQPSEPRHLTLKVADPANPQRFIRRFAARR